MRIHRTLGIILLLAAAPFVFAQDDTTRLLRYADIHGDMIAFVYAGDIWTVDAGGGVAKRLTSHDGLELFPRFSPDGRWIAFTGDYSGSRQVHVISVKGGEPRQLTFYNDVGPLPPRGGVDNQVLGWTPDGTKVLFLAHRLPWGERMERHYVVPFEGGMETPLEIPEGFGGMFSPDGTKLVYTPIGREFRTWKRYRGGRAQDVWIYDLANHSSEQITDFVGTDNQPMWVDGKIYFTSDRTGILNLYEYDLATRTTRQVTSHADWDILWPSAGPHSIVYEAGGWIWRFDPKTGQTAKVPIEVYGDFKGTIPYYQKVKDNIQNATISPSGKRVLFEARGEIFSVPAKDGETRNLTATSGVREVSPSWSPDGAWMAWLSDQTGEYELFVQKTDGSEPAKRITTGGDTWRFQPVWSPDSSRLAFGDKHSKLRWLDVKSGRITDVDMGRFNDLTYYRWSPDSKWIVYTKAGESLQSALWLYSIEQSRTFQLTSGDTNDYNPVFDPEGRYLYFLSDRDFNLTFSGFEFDYLYTDPTRVYVGILASDGVALFKPKSDEETGTPADTPKKDDEEKDEKKAEPKKDVRIDIAGFESRVTALPGKPGNYRSLEASASAVFYLSGDGQETKLQMFDIKEEKEQTVLEGVTAYELSAKGDKVLFRNGGNWGIADAKPGQKSSDGTLDLGRLETRIDPRAEWQQEFADAWRTFRDWFYDPNMHGVDWNAMRTKYEPLVAHINHRTDLDYILGELGGELNSGHVYIQSSQDWQPDEIQSGLLGAEIVSDPSGLFRIDRIFPGENWHEDFRSPLTEPGVNVRAGDYIIEVDGVSTKSVANFYQLLENKAGRVVRLRVNSTPGLEGAREEKVRPIRQEVNLRYLDWIKSRREYVEKKSNGRIGYIHLPNTATEGNRELYRGFYAQSHKDALIFDARYNGGGFIPGTMIELIERPILSRWARRNIEPFVTPGIAHQGPKVTLINGYSSSGGDAFPYYFRKRGLGKLIGTRTWGGLIGLSGNTDLMDGGSVLVPTFRFFDEGMWEVENEGVRPDIEVIDRPELIMRGIDPSLDKAIEVLLEDLERNPPSKPVTPTPPIETGPPQR